MTSERNRAGRDRGYSVLELVVVLALSGLMLVTVATTTRPDQRSAALRVAREIAADLEVARMAAISRQEVTTVTALSDGRSYTVAPRGLHRRLPSGAVIELDGQQTTTISFDKRGVLTTTEGLDWTISGHDKAALLTVTPSGQISVTESECEEPL